MSHVSSHRSIPVPVKLGLPLAVLGLAAAACSSSGGSSGSTSVAAGGNSSPAASSPAASGAVVTTHSGAMGTYLTDGSGRTLYLWVADPMDKSVCSGACASLWPPLTTNAAPTASGGVKASDLGTIARSGGTKQVTYDGHALYYYTPDTAAGQTKGQGSSQFGAKWWLVAPSGAAITATSGGSAQSSHSSSKDSKSSSSSKSSSESGGGGWA
jgi:predicted lipoprotein with Yx(FWY)xxD motif